jgi:hypothetical protein
VSDTVGIRSRRQVIAADWLRAARVLVTRGRSAFDQSSKQTQGQRETLRVSPIPLLNVLRAAKDVAISATLSRDSSGSDCTPRFVAGP